MKKSLIWLLTIVMLITFLALLYFQIMYLENMVSMRNAQFNEGVMRSLSATSDFLEKQETLYFLEQDVNIIESSFYEDYSNDGTLGNSSSGYITTQSKTPASVTDTYAKQAMQGVGARYGSMQEVIRNQYLYQKGLLTDVILSILRDSGSRPLAERADSTLIKNCLRTELANNGLNVPFDFAVYNSRNKEMYATQGYQPEKKGEYSVELFGNTDTPFTLDAEFPTKQTYIFSSVRFIIPSLAFTLILLIVFLYTVILAFRQKKLTEMKTDFINNMTHELKTPISTISLAGQMLSEPSIRKSEQSLKHLSDVITEESKRLRFQVEKVLQLSVLDNGASTLKFTEVNANQIISNVANTFKLKVEKQGGDLQTDLEARNSEVVVDEMQFTNVIFNLLDNALKYMREDVDPHLKITSRDTADGQLEIRVADNGIGIKKEDQKHIFEKFYRVSTGNRHDVKGFGLGLAYVKKMIQAFDGQISVESELGKGSTFIILLPLIRQGQRRGETPRESAEAPEN